MIAQIKVKEHRLCRLNSQMGWVVIAAVVLSICCLVVVGQAQQDQEVEIDIEIKHVQGEVSSITTPNNPRYIGITYKEDKESSTAYEMVLYIDKDLRLVHKRQLSEIGIGDTVDVTYHKITETTEEGRKSIKQVAKMIRFVRRADKDTRHKYGIYTEEEKREMREAEASGG